MDRRRKQSRHIVERPWGGVLELGRLQLQELVQRQRKLLPREQQRQTKINKKIHKILYFRTVLHLTKALNILNQRLRFVTNYITYIGWNRFYMQ